MSLRRLLWKFDLLGLGFFLASIVCFLMAMEWGGIAYAWSDYRVVITLVFFCVRFPWLMPIPSVAPSR